MDGQGDLGRVAAALGAAGGEVYGGGVAGLRRNRPPGHDFERWLAWERESETGNAPSGMRRASTGKAKRSAVARDGGSPA